MTAVVLAGLAGLLVAVGLWVLAAGLFEVQPLERTNYRGAAVPTGAGLLIPLTAIVVGAAVELVLLGSASDPAWSQLIWTVLLATTAFGLLGLLDDVMGVGQSGGFRQHLGAIARGQLTTGTVKLFVGGAAGVLVASTLPVSGSGVVTTLRDGGIVALAANLANLFDRAPGRCIKVSVSAFVVATLVSRRAELAGPAAGVGAALALLPADLRERVMLGDSGANPLGALVGLAWLVALPSNSGRWSLLVVFLALNIASEVVSFSTVIDRVAPLRWFDRLGSLRS